MPTPLLHDIRIRNPLGQERRGIELFWDSMLFGLDRTNKLIEFGF